MGWTVYVGREEVCDITYNYGRMYRVMIPGGLSALRGVSADEAATIIWHGFRHLRRLEDTPEWEPFDVALCRSDYKDALLSAF